ncbi:MAG: hypothetical protein SFW07_00130 [Gammaproteobacteria bacterium]|nr:hypothetical protein [Gammaproteobacteria bacterium]
MDMDKRQKVIAGFLVMAVVVLVWQIYALLGSEPSVPVTAATTIPTFNITKANKKDYTVQLIAKKSQNEVDNFISGNKLSEKIQTLKINHNRELWYIGLYGDFLTVDEANKAIEDLPSSVKTQKPFVRRIDDVLKGVVK